ncbi:MAG: EF-hand domain-containing protein [Candidatus Poseidoniaceae archaeon]|nr:EF-hand domain-containing protein [Candidatus Poseidoniaceae archaeon]
MNKKFAIVMALFMTLAGCTESIEEEINDIIVIPGCDDSTAFNYDENATNSDACLTELALEQAIMNFMTTVEQGPTDANSSMGMTVTSTSSDGMSASTEMVFTPNGAAIFTSMSGEMDIGGMMMPLSFMSEQTVIPNPDGTDTTVIHMVYNDESQEFTMDNAVPWNVVVADMMADDDDHDDDMDGDHGDDDHGDEMVCYDMSTHTVDDSYDNQADCESAGLMWTAASGGPGGHDDHGDDDMGGDMDMSAPESPDADEILDGFDVMNSSYALALSTDAGYSFTSTMLERGETETGATTDFTTTFTFILDSTFKVTSISATNDMESMTVTLLSDAEIAGYFDADWSSLATEALPFSVMPMDGGHDDHGDDDDHDDHGDDDHDDHGDDDHDDHGDGDGDHDDDDDLITPEQLLADIDSDESGTMSLDEFNAFFGGSDEIDVNDPEFSEIFDNNDADASGDLDSYELEGFIMELDAYLEGGHDDHGDEMVCYDMSTHTVDDSYDNQADCEAAGLMWTAASGGPGGHDGHSDDDMPSEGDMFEMGDVNDDGFINMSEMEDLFSGDHDDHDDDTEPPTPEEAMENDTDSSGGISWSEFYDAWEVSNAEDVADGEENMSMVDDPVLESDLHQAFNDSDIDGDGELNLTELQTFIDELEHMFGSDDDDHDERTFHCSSTIGGTPDTEIPFSQVNDGTEDCGDGSDEPQDTDGDGTVDNWFDCMDGSNVSMELVNDGNDDCPDGDDESHDHDDDHDDDGDMGAIMMYFNYSDADGDGVLSADEFTTFYNNINDDSPSLEMLFGMMDSDGDGMITASEYSDWANESTGVSEPMSEEDWNEFVDMFSYMDTNSDGGMDLEEFSSLMGSMDDDDDHDGHDHGDHDGHMHGPLDWVIVEADMSMPPIAGDLSNYYAVLSKCTIPDDDSDDGDMMMDMGGAPEMDCGPDIMFTPLSSANDPNAIFFHDADSSGTLTFGDMVHVSENATSEEWTHVRLYSASADSYSDENPMMAPGFTGVIGMIALLGAALLTRRD